MTIIQISPKEAFDLLSKDSDSILIDVRTMEEYTFVGGVDTSKIEERIMVIPWKNFPDMKLNPDFNKILEGVFDKALGKENRSKFKMVFMCRSGARSQEAAQYCLSLGFTQCYNIVGGFEGDLDENQHRSNTNGWKAANLPWKQK